MIHKLLLGVAVCMGLANSASADDAAYITIEIGDVRVEPTRPGGAGAWDGAAAAADNQLCAAVMKTAGAAVGVALTASPVGAGVGGAVGQQFCGRGTKQQQRDPRAPDLLITLSIGPTLAYHLPIANNAYAHHFGYQILVPLDAVPKIGAKLLVRDQDGASVGDGELLGSFRLTRKMLRELAGADSPILTLQDGAVKKLELIAHRELPKKEAGKAKLPVSKNRHATPFHVTAGQIVTLRTSGAYSVASSGQRIGPEGYPGMRYREYNLKGLQALPHGSALAWLETLVIPVGSCTQLIAPLSGALALGLNDRSPNNNRGVLEVHYSIAAGSAAQWTQPGALRACPPLPDENPEGLGSRMDEPPDDL